MKRSWPILALALGALLLARGVGETETASGAAEVPQAGLLALTFDDGPGEPTDLLLDGLGERGVEATFFLLGENIPGREETVRRMAREGHELGVHSYSHVDFTQLSPAALKSELDRTRARITELTGKAPALVRPPYGFYNPTVQKHAGAPLIRWSLDTLDWQDKNAARVVDYLTENARDGDVILMHDIYPESAQAALRAVDALRAMGFEFTTVSALFAAKGAALEPGGVYTRPPG